MQSRKEHLTKEGFNKLLAIKASVNNGLSDDLKANFPNIIPVDKPQVKLPTSINPYWLTGFTSADGCFLVNCSKSSKSKFGYKTELIFSLSQHSRDAQLMKSLVQHFGCGGYYAWSTCNRGEFRVTSFSDVFEYVMPFFNKYPIMGVKSLDFADFCKVAELMK